MTHRELLDELFSLETNVCGLKEVIELLRIASEIANTDYDDNESFPPERIIKRLRILIDFSIAQLDFDQNEISELKGRLINSLRDYQSTKKTSGL